MTEIKLPGGGYLIESPDAKELNVIPFKKYRLNRVVKPEEKEEEYEELTTLDTVIIFFAVMGLIALGFII